MLEIGLSRIRMCQNPLQHLSRGGFPLLQAPRHRKLPTALFRFSLLGQIRSKRPIRSKKTYLFFDPIHTRNHIHLIGIEKVRTVILATAPLGKRETPPDFSWRELRHILRRKRPIFNIAGAKAHANVLKAAFSTDSKPDCKRSGLRFQYLLKFLRLVIAGKSSGRV